MRQFLKHLIRGLTVPAVPLVLLASTGCDTTLEAADADVRDAADVASSLASDAHAVYVPNMSIPRMAASSAAATAATQAAAALLTVHSAPADLFGASFETFMPILAAYPGLATALASGELGAVDAIAHELTPLPTAAQALAGAPWLMQEGSIVLATNSADSSDERGARAANPANVDFAALGLGQGAKLVTVPASKDQGGLFIARSNLRLDALPAAQRTLIGRAVRVFDAHGERCVARVTALALESQLVHNTGEEYGEDDKPVIPKHTATDVVAGGQTFLLASLEPIIGSQADCAAGLWAAPIGNAPAVQVFKDVTTDKAFARVAVRAFRALPEWRVRQHDYRNYYSDPAIAPHGNPGDARWDTYGNVAGPAVTTLITRDGTRELVTVAADTTAGCGDPGQSMTAVFEVVRSGKEVTFKPLAELPWTGAPTAIVDWNGDGTLEFLYDQGVAGNSHDGKAVYHVTPKLAPDDSPLAPVRAYDVPDLTMYGCGC